MYEWYKLIQIAVDEIDERIKRHDDAALTLRALSRRLGFSEFHTTRRFREISGMRLGDYIRLRKLAFALIEVRDSRERFLDIAFKYGFESHEAFTRAFRNAYGVTPKHYRQNPLPVVLRTKISVLDRYFLGKGEIGMVKSTEDVKVYFITMQAHKFLHIKNYESRGYWDFWEKQGEIPGADCDTVCGLLDSVKGKLDGRDEVIGQYSGQIMAHIYEDGGKIAEAYGVRLPANYNGLLSDGPLSDGLLSANMLLIDIPEKEYIVFEHGPFNFEKESGAVGEKLEEAINAFDFSKTEYRSDTSSGRISYFYFVPESFEKRIQPVTKK